MKIKTIHREDNIQITLTQTELVWLQVLFSSIQHGDSLTGWYDEIMLFSNILKEVKEEGKRIKPTTMEFENTELTFLGAHNGKEETN